MTLPLVFKNDAVSLAAPEDTHGLHDIPSVLLVPTPTSSNVASPRRLPPLESRTVCFPVDLTTCDHILSAVSRIPEIGKIAAGFQMRFGWPITVYVSKKTCFYR